MPGPTNPQQTQPDKSRQGNQPGQSESNRPDQDRQRSTNPGGGGSQDDRNPDSPKRGKLRPGEIIDLDADADVESTDRKDPENMETDASDTTKDQGQADKPGQQPPRQI